MGLGKLAERLRRRSTADISPVIAQQYAGVSVADFDLKIRGMMIELALQAASGQELDVGRIARLNAAWESWL